jgi:16S rRNA (guanine(527)-N(7))-methyltransferase RsmG
VERDRPASREALPIETRDRLRTYVDLLLRWNARINLIGRATEDEVWTRHIDDSLQLAPLLPAGAIALADLGSGAGFPGLVLSIAGGLPVTLIESDRRKASFLAEAARLTAAPATIAAHRVEDVPPLSTRLITARAFAPLPKLLPLAARHLAPGGVLLLPKGARSEDELTAAAAGWHMRVERFPSRTAPDATILRISELRPVDHDRPPPRPRA